MKTQLTKRQAAHVITRKFNRPEIKVSMMKMTVSDEWGNILLDLNELTADEILNLDHSMF